MRLDKEQQADFIEILESALLNEGLGDIRPYSGRGMYGKQCVAVSGDFLNPFRLALMIVAYRHNFPIYDIPVPDVDSCGRGIVIYWPQVEWPEDRIERAEEEEDEWA